MVTKKHNQSLEDAIAEFSYRDPAKHSGTRKLCVLLAKEVERLRTAEKERNEAPDRYCVTLANGSCVSTDPRCMHNSHTVGAHLHNAIMYSRDERALLTTSHAAGMKLMEEVGEFAEAILIEGGYLPHKPPAKEPAIGEAADVILMVMQVLANHYPDMDPLSLLDYLRNQLALKLMKWKEKVLEFSDEDVGD